MTSDVAIMAVASSSCFLLDKGPNAAKQVFPFPPPLLLTYMFSVLGANSAEQQAVSHGLAKLVKKPNAGAESMAGCGKN